MLGDGQLNLIFFFFFKSVTTGVLGAWPMLVSPWEARSPAFCSVV